MDTQTAMTHGGRLIVLRDATSAEVSMCMRQIDFVIGERALIQLKVNYAF